MPVSGLRVKAAFDGAATMDTPIFGSDLEFTNVGNGIAQRVKIEIFMDEGATASGWELIINGDTYELNETNDIEGIFTIMFFLINTDTLNLQPTVSTTAIVRVLTE